MRLKSTTIKIFLFISITSFWIQGLQAEHIQITVNNPSAGAPITLGIPFPQGVLSSPDQVRLLDRNGLEIPAQINMVTTWEPVDYSVKWIWVFFFCEDDDQYILEYGPGVRKMPIEGPKIKIKNAQRSGQTSMVNTGPLQFSISKKQGGFIDDVLYDVDENGFDESDTIAVSAEGRGSFLDILDSLGLDESTATVHRTVRERGSGPLHAIMRLEGEYVYSRADNRTSPFVIRIHLYAGKSYIRVFHTLTYTGVPDKHTPLVGEHANIALTADSELIDDSATLDSAWMKPNDQIAATGLCLKYNFDTEVSYRCGYRNGTWSDPTTAEVFRSQEPTVQTLSVVQKGPKADRIPPVPNSTGEERISGFEALITADDATAKKMDRAEGWAAISDDRWGIGLGIRHFLEEYPKEISFDLKNDEATAYFWSPQADPMSFARHSVRRDQGMISNFAEGVTKTSEMVIDFHPSGQTDERIKMTIDYFLDPPVAHANPETYAKSKAFGKFAPRSDKYLALERALDYKFDWQLFNQHWEPWYGMFDFGDQKNSFFRDDWYRWQNNEPAIDYMYWLQFMRTGKSKYFHAAEAMSRHTMDVDNVHWPTDPTYFGDTNESRDWFEDAARKTTATPYLGVGRRHAQQHWVALLSAHVWLEGWATSYYLTGYHRGLDIVRLTADSYLRRIWGEHGLTGRRLYLSLWNLVEAYDATKDSKYLEELKDRVARTLHFQNGPNQYDNLVIDRYGYSQIYASHGLSKYYQLTKDEKVRQALIRHARAVRDNPPYNHEYESLLATIHGLVLGYEYTGDKGFLTEAISRSEVMKTDPLPQTFAELGNQKDISTALEAASHLPRKGDFQARARWVSNWGPTQGLRVFGWTHIYNIPWLIHAMEEVEKK